MAQGKRLFITGIPTGGKSYLAKKLAAEIDGLVVSTDDMRAEMWKDEKYKKWVDYFSDQDEKTYYTSTTPDEQWEKLVTQSEAMWPFILERIRSYDAEGKTVIFEGVNILPHIAKRDLPFNGVSLIGTSREHTFQRIKEDNRWGDTEELWNLEADSFFNVERPRYKAEAEKYGYEVFETADGAFETVLDMLK